MLARVQEKALAARLANIRFAQVGFGEGKAKKDYYDRAMLVTVLGEIPAQEAALKEIHAALKPGWVLSLLQGIGAGVVLLGLLVAGPISDRQGIQPWFLYEERI